MRPLYDRYRKIKRLIATGKVRNVFIPLVVSIGEYFHVVPQTQSVMLFSIFHSNIREAASDENGQFHIPIAYEIYF